MKTDQETAPICLKTPLLRKTFNDLAVVDDLLLEIKKREIFGVLVPNGIGKSTSTRMISGMFKPDIGKVFLNGIIFDICKIIYSFLFRCIISLQIPIYL
jgi:ABC-type multidrug transport system ATPase subunit